MEQFENLGSYESLWAKPARVRGRTARRDHTQPLGMLWTIWRFAAIEVEIAYEEWCNASDGERGTAYAVYIDSLRREGEAAERLARRYDSPRSVPA